MKATDSVFTHLGSIDFAKCETTPALYLESWERVHEAIEREADIKQKALLATIQKFFYEEITNPEKRQRIALHEIASTKGWPESYPQEFKERITHLCEAVIHRDAEHGELLKVITVCRAALNELFHPEITLTSNVHMSVIVRRCTLLEGEYFTGVFSLENEKTDFELDCSDAVLKRLHHYLETGTIELEVLQDPEALKELLEKAHFWVMPQLCQLCWQGLLKFKEKHVDYILWAHRHYEKDFLDALIQQQPKDALCFFTSPKPGELLVEIPTWKGSAYTLGQVAKAVTEVVNPQALKQIIAEARDLLALLFEPDSTLCTEKGEAIVLWRGFLHEGEGILDLLTPEDTIPYQHSYQALKGLKMHLETGKLGKEITQNSCVMEELLMTAHEWEMPRLFQECSQTLLQNKKRLTYYRGLAASWKKEEWLNTIQKKLTELYRGFTLSSPLDRLTLTVRAWKNNYSEPIEHCGDSLKEILFDNIEAFFQFLDHPPSPLPNVTTIDIASFTSNYTRKKDTSKTGALSSIPFEKLTEICPNLRLACVPTPPDEWVPTKQWLERFPGVRLLFKGLPLSFFKDYTTACYTLSSDEQLLYLVQHPKNTLSNLELVSERITDPLLEKISTHYSSIITSHTVCIPSRQIRTHSPQIHSLTLDSLSQVTPEGLSHLIKLTPSLKTLAFRSMDQLTDEILVQFLDSAKGLSTLELRSCHGISEESLAKALSLRIANLKVIECKNIEGKMLVEMVAASKPSKGTETSPSSGSAIDSLEFKGRSPPSYKQCLSLLEAQHCRELSSHHLTALQQSLTLTKGSLSKKQEFLQLLETLYARGSKAITHLNFEEMKIEGEYGELCLISNRSKLPVATMNLYHLSFSKGAINPSFLQSLIKASPYLHTLKLKDCTGLDLAALLRLKEMGLLAHLTTLHVSGCKGFTADMFFSLLEGTVAHTFECDLLDERGMEHLVKTHSMLMRGLAIYDCHKLPSSALKLLMGCKRLESLTLSDAPELEDQTLVELLSKLPNLSTLQLINCPKITDLSLECLEELSKKTSFSGLKQLTLENTAVTALGILSLKLHSPKTVVEQGRIS